MINQLIHVGARQKVRSKDVVCIIGDANYSKVVLVNGKKIHVATTLKTLENRAVAFGFFRTNKGSLVNLIHISHFSDEQGIMTLINDLNIQLSRRKKKQFSQLNF